MSVDLSSSRLLLNPRLPAEAREDFEKAWRELVLPRYGNGRNGTEPVIGITTSGSSGDARGRLIVLSRAALLASAASVNEWFGATRADVWMKSLPSFHVGGLGIEIRARLGGASVVESKLERWDARAFRAELERSGATLLSLVPTQLFDLVALSLRAPPRLRVAVLGGGRLETGLRARALALGWPVYASYGLTECCSQVATEKPRAEKPSARDADGGEDGVRTEAKLFPLSHVSLRTREQRIEVRSPSLLSAQVVFGERGAELREQPPGEWFRTEDHGELAADESLIVLGRAGDFVKIGGEGVVVARLEDRLELVKHELGFSFDAAVLAAEDARLGAVIVLVTNASREQASALVEKFNVGVLPFERIRETHRLAQLPRTELGKLQRAAALEAVGLRALAKP